MKFQECVQSGKALFKAGKYFDCEKTLVPAIEEADSGSVPKAEQAAVFLEYGRVLLRLARLLESESYVNKAKSIYEEEPGRQSHEYSECLRELGMLKHESYQGTDAIALLQEALKIRRAIYKAPSNEIALILNDLGEANWKAGDNTAALTCLDEALAMQKEVLGEMHEDYAESLENRSLVLLKADKLDEALAGVRQSLDIREKCLGPEHPKLCSSWSNLSAILKSKGITEGNEERLKRALDIALKAYGEDSVRTAVITNNLGGFYMHEGNLLESEKYLNKALATKEKILGKDNQALINTLSCLAIVYKGLGRLDEVREVRERYEKLLLAKLASGPKKDVDSLIQLADKLIAHNQKKEARPVLLEALNEAIANFGADSLKVAQVLKFFGLINLAHLHQQTVVGDTSYLVDLDLGTDCYAAALRIQKKQLGPKHPDLADTLGHLATCMTMQGSQDLAQLLNQQAKVIRHASGVEDPTIKAMLMMLNRRKDSKGEKDPSVTMSLRTLAHMYEQRGDQDKADDYYEQYIKAREHELGSDSPELAREFLLKAMGLLPMRFMRLVSQSKPENIDEESVNKAIGFLERGVAIRERILSETENEDLITDLSHLSNAYILVDRLDDAERTVHRSIELAERYNGTDHWSLAFPLKSLIDVLQAQGKTEEVTAIEERKKGLRERTREEEQESSRLLKQRTFGDLGKMLQGLVASINPEEGAPAENAANAEKAENAKKTETAKSD